MAAHDCACGWNPVAGVLYLYMKSIERSHTPNALWERIKLPKDYGEALKVIDAQMIHWPKFLVHKNKQRLTKMTQYLIRMKKLQVRVRPKVVTMPAKQQQRESRREAKAEVAARLDRAIEAELLERLKSGTYGDIYNFPTKQYEKVVAMEEMEEELEEEEEEEEEEAEVEYVEDYEADEEMNADLEDLEDVDDAVEESDEDEGAKRRSSSSSGVDVARKKRRAHVEVEYEQEEVREVERGIR